MDHRSELQRVTAELVTERAEVARLHGVLDDLVSAVSAHLARGEDTTPGDFDRAWKAACAVLEKARQP
jgi:hypothetical protein